MSYVVVVQGLVGLYCDSVNFVVDFRGDSGWDYYLCVLIVDIFGVVGVKFVVEDDFIVGVGLWVVVIQYCIFNFLFFNVLFYYYFMVKFEGQGYCLMVLFFVFNFVDVN